MQSAPARLERSMRRYERLELEVQVDLVSDHNFFTGFSSNVSEGGLFVATHCVRDVGSRLELRFTLPGDDAEIVAHTEVRWVREYSESSNAGPGMGLQFVEIAPESLARIGAFLKAREPLFYED